MRVLCSANTAIKHKGLGVVLRRAVKQGLDVCIERTKLDLSNIVSFSSHLQPSLPHLTPHRYPED